MIFLGSTLITCTYAMVAFTPRQFTWLWLGYGAVTALALFAGHERFDTPAPTPLNIAILWLFFFMGVRRLALTGAQFSRLREQLSEKNKQLTILLERNKELASHDELTGAFNRRQLMQLLVDERDRARPHARVVLGRHLRPRPLQDDQRPLRPRGRRRGAQALLRARLRRPCAAPTASRATAARSSCC